MWNNPRWSPEIERYGGNASPSWVFSTKTARLVVRLARRPQSQLELETIATALIDGTPPAEDLGGTSATVQQLEETISPGGAAQPRLSALERPSPHPLHHQPFGRHGPLPGRAEFCRPPIRSCASTAGIAPDVLRKGSLAPIAAPGPMRPACEILRQRLMAAERGPNGPHATLPRSCSTWAGSPLGDAAAARTQPGWA